MKGSLAERAPSQPERQRELRGAEQQPLELRVALRAGGWAAPEGSESARPKREPPAPERPRPEQSGRPQREPERRSLARLAPALRLESRRRRPGRFLVG